MMRNLAQPRHGGLVLLQHGEVTELPSPEEQIGGGMRGKGEEGGGTGISM